MEQTPEFNICSFISKMLNYQPRTSSLSTDWGAQLDISVGGADFLQKVRSFIPTTFTNFNVILVYMFSLKFLGRSRTSQIFFIISS